MNGIKRELVVGVDGLSLSLVDIQYIRDTGLSTKEVAMKYKSDESRVKTHYSRLYVKFGVSNKVGLLVKALKLHVIGIDEVEYDGKTCGTSDKAS
jgi:hypothetical protein